MLAFQLDFRRSSKEIAEGVKMFRFEALCIIVVVSYTVICCLGVEGIALNEKLLASRCRFSCFISLFSCMSAVALNRPKG